MMGWTMASSWTLLSITVSTVRPFWNTLSHRESSWVTGLGRRERVSEAEKVYMVHDGQLQRPRQLWGVVFRRARYYSEGVRVLHEG